MERRDLIDEISKQLTPLRETRKYANEAAVTFAQLGLKTIFLLNGGALIALPAYLSFKNQQVGIFDPWAAASISLDTSSPSHFAGWAGAAFVVGLVTCALNTMVAYQIMVLQGRALRYRELMSEHQTRAFYMRDLANQEKQQALVAEERAKDIEGWSEKIWVFGVILYFLTVSSFIAGSGMALIYVTR